MTLDLDNADQLRSALATVAAIPVTPFGPDGQVDWDAHGRVIRRRIAEILDGWGLPVGEENR